MIYGLLYLDASGLDLLDVETLIVVECWILRLLAEEAA